MAAHVLVVGTGGAGAELLRTLGAATTLMCRPEFLPHVRGLAEYERVLGCRADASDEEWIQLAKEIDRVRPLTSVVAFGELDQDRAAAIGQALGLTAHSVETVHRVQDKQAMRRRLRETGVDPTPAATVAGPEQIREFLDRHGGPLIVKPVQGAGSVGVTVVRDTASPAEIVRAYEAAAAEFMGVPRAGVVVERFHDGPQFSVEALSEDGEHHVLAVVRKFYEPVGFVELGHVVPAGLPEADEAAVTDFVRRALDALGVTRGPTHTEIVLTADGPRMIETHLRPAGDEIPDLVHEATGVDLLRYTARQALGEAVLGELRAETAARTPDRYAAIWFTLPDGGGELLEIRLPADGTVHALLEPGDDIAFPANSDSRVAAARARAATSDEAVRTARRAAEGVRAVVAAPLVTTVAGDPPEEVASCD
ncbi:ATP-grasp domain-containing protein [Streptomyces sp. DH10]|uniref:ATP-grasp domain-containing protein n=1 Tax=Streptomyces sp. DH10 TaxID=3040121 RepID=UPI002442A9BD|nr:ATP-grasp domain-containing protein [Streptomyces sp. DH10]MDG9711940.1 ATP-grasp domain-containing protein [Streptomyces sp. DH10]